MPSSKLPTETRRSLATLFVFINEGDVESVVRLVKEKPDLVEHNYVGGLSALAKAVLCGQLEVCTALVKLGASLEWRDGCENTLLHVAVRENKLAIIRWICATDKNLYIDARNEDGETAVFLASSSNAVLSCLLEKTEPDLSLSRYHTEKSPLHMATEASAATLLLARGAPADKRDADRTTALQYAAQGGSTELILALIDGGADVTLTDRFGRDPLALYVSRIVKLQEEDMEELQYPPLTMAELSVIRRLLNRGADPGHTALEMALSFQRNDLITEFLASARVLTSDKRDSYGYTLLHNLCKAGPLQAVIAETVMHRLLEGGADVNCVGTDGCTPLVLAAAHGSLPLVSCLLRHDAALTPPAEANTKRYHGNDSLLHCAIRGANAEVIRLLLTKAKELGVKLECRSPLLAAITQHAPPEIIAHLIKLGGFRAEADEIHLAARDGDVKVMTMLLMIAVSPDLQDAAGDTPLCVAASRGHASAARVLLAAGASPQLGLMPPLHQASLRGHEAVVKILIDNGVDVNQISRTGTSALFQASVQRQWTIAVMLLAAGAIVNPYVEPNDTCCSEYPDRHPHLEHSPLWNTLEYERMDWLKFFVEFMEPQPYDQVSMLLEIVSSYSQNHPSFIVDTSMLDTLKLVYKSMRTEVRSLARLSSLAARSYFYIPGRRFLDVIESLPLPGPIQQQILMTSVINSAPPVAEPRPQLRFPGGGEPDFEMLMQMLANQPGLQL